MRAIKSFSAALVVIGLGFNFLDAYFSGNLSFSPSSSSSSNKISVLNRLGKGADAPFYQRLGSILAAIGAAVFVFAYLRKR